MITIVSRAGPAGSGHPGRPGSEASERNRHVQVTQHVPDRARHPGRGRRDHRAGLALGHGAGAGHLVRRLRVHRRRPAGRAGVQQPQGRAGPRAPAARPGRPGRRGDRAGLAGAHRAGPGADRGRVGDHRRPGRVLRRLRRRRAGRDPGHVHPGRAGHRRVRRGAVRPPRPRRDHPRAAVRPVQPDRRDLDAGAGHRTAPHRQDPARRHTPLRRKRTRPEPCPDKRNHARSAEAPRAAR